eukprot:4441434-Pyramimonas_sp.AAC.1
MSRPCSMRKVCVHRTQVKVKPELSQIAAIRVGRFSKVRADRETIIWEWYALRSCEHAHSAIPVHHHYR